jgi:hypothetical protein
MDETVIQDLDEDIAVGVGELGSLDIGKRRDRDEEDAGQRDEKANGAEVCTKPI